MWRRGIAAKVLDFVVGISWNFSDDVIMSSGIVKLDDSTFMTVQVLGFELFFFSFF
jgi:hypothetical protein